MEILRNIRADIHGGSMRSMAKDLGISASYYQKLEYGKKPITLHVVERLYAMSEMFEARSGDQVLGQFGYCRCELCGKLYEKRENPP